MFALTEGKLVSINVPTDGIKGIYRVKGMDKYGRNNKEEVINELKSQISDREDELSTKNKELAAIIKETEKEEKALLKKSEKAQVVIEERLLSAYNRIRGKVRNGLAVVSVDRDACGGCFNQIPPQRQLDIQMHKKVIVCEHCGRILVDSNILES